MINSNMTWPQAYWTYIQSAMHFSMLNNEYFNPEDIDIFFIHC